jgi:hypothetical protein
MSDIRQSTLLLRPTFNPMQRIVPTSSCAKGDKILSIDSVLSVRVPGDRTEDPVNTSTETSFPSRMARPMSRSSCDGSPIRILVESDLGTNRTRPGKLVIKQAIVASEMLLTLESSRYHLGYFSKCKVGWKMVNISLNVTERRCS